MRQTAIPLRARIGLKAIADEGRGSWQARLVGAKERLAVHEAKRRAFWDQEAAATRDLIGRLKAGEIASYCWRHDTGGADVRLVREFWQSDRAFGALHGERLFATPGSFLETSGYHFTVVVSSSDLATAYGLAPIDKDARPFDAPNFKTLENWVGDPETGAAARLWAQQNGKEWRTRKNVAEAMHGLLQLLPEMAKGSLSSIEKFLQGLEIQPPLEKPEKLPIVNRNNSRSNRK